MDTRRMVMGDWNRVVRDPIDLVRATLVVGTAGYALTGTAGAGVLAAGAAVVVAARFANLPRVYDLSFVAAMALAAWGEVLGLYDRWGWFDVVVHFSVPFLGAPVLYIALARLEVVPDPREDTTHHHHLGIFVVTLALGLAIGALWEVLEWSSDEALGSSLSLTKQDVIGDLVADAAGATLGAVLLVVWTVRGWGSVRRIPGENRREQAIA
jgi:hypothetical protein